jgi:pimeloyl-CoA synthetase
MSHIFKKVTDGKKEEFQVNWPFWNEQRQKFGDFSIYIDEIHNIMHSRRSMSKENIVLSKWFSQIRKVCGSSETTDLVIISQEENKVDIDIKNLAQEIIYCSKLYKGTVVCDAFDGARIEHKKMRGVYIMQYKFTGAYCLEKYLQFRNGAKSYDERMVFCGNPYMKYYNSHEFITMGDETWL